MLKFKYFFILVVIINIDLYSQDLDAEKYIINVATSNINNNVNISENYLLRGNCYLKLKEYYKSEKDYNKALFYDSTNTEAFLNKAILYTEIKKYEQAKIYFDTYLKVSKIISQDYYFYLGLLYFKQSKYNKSILEFAKIQENNENYLDAIYNIAMANIKMKEYNNSVKYLNKYISFDVNNFTVYYYLGISFYYTNMYNEAISNFIKSLKLNDEQNYIFMYLAESYYFTEKKDSCCIYYNKAINNGIKIDAKFKKYCTN